MLIDDLSREDLVSDLRTSWRAVSDRLGVESPARSCASRGTWGDPACTSTATFGSTTTAASSRWPWTSTRWAAPSTPASTEVCGSSCSATENATRRICARRTSSDRGSPTGLNSPRRRSGVRCSCRSAASYRTASRPRSIWPACGALAWSPLVGRSAQTFASRGWSSIDEDGCEPHRRVPGSSATRWRRSAPRRTTPRRRRAP